MNEPRIIPVGEESPPMEPADRPACCSGQSANNAEPKPKRSAGQRAGAVRRRFGLLNTFIDWALPRLCRTDVAAWLLLFRHAKPDGTVAASVADLAQRAGCQERAMRNALRRLQATGLVRRLKRGTLAGGPSVWRLLTPGGADASRHRDAG